MSTQYDPDKLKQKIIDHVLHIRKIDVVFARSILKRCDQNFPEFGLMDEIKKILAKEAENSEPDRVGVVR